MDLGSFYIALAVQDLKVSRAFYEKLGFTVFDGKEEQNWLMLRNGETKLGLFQGMFEKNMLTFHPSDVKAIQESLKNADVELAQEVDDSSEQVYISLVDPDGNPILMDQM
ncbi:MAG: VOC family protein [Chloroflexota bacterium]